MAEKIITFLSVSQKELLEQVASSKDGLTGEEAQRRLGQYGPNTIEAKMRTTTLALLFNPFKSPIILILLLANLMTDIPEMTIAEGSVDREVTERLRRWKIKFIRNFMLTSGILSSTFDCMTFGVLRLLLHANQEQFRTGRFLESVVSATVSVLVIRTRKLFFKNRPHYSLALANSLIASFMLALPYTPDTPVAKIFAFQPVPPLFLFALGRIVLFYIIAAESTKKLFYKRVKSA
jgi:Mg2+-importing ATPase